ncbi:MAG: 3-ketoacyl-ACP reductase [Planctomycetota bacterium]
MAQQSSRIALVTGGSRGLGLGIAKQLASDGFKLAINGRKPASEVTGVVEELQALGTEAIYVSADVSDADSRMAMLAEIRRVYGRLDVLINNAGIAPLDRADILDASEESFERLMEVNLQGPYFLTQAVAKWMIDQRVATDGFAGVIVNISSVSAELASVNRGEYCISKAGVAMATKLWAMRLAEYGIQVYEVRPGIFRTDMTDAVRDKYDALLQNGLTLDPRWGEPAELGQAVSLLVSGKLSYATGNVLTVDGGLTLPRL